MNAVATDTDLAHAKELNDAHIARVDEALKHLRELGESQRAGDQLAVETALTSAKELALGHNGLIRKQEKAAETYATKEEVAAIKAFQARLAGGGLVLAFIGISNLVKVWGG